MKKLSVLSFFMAKLVSLYCFTTMGLVTAYDGTIKEPCHGAPIIEQTVANDCSECAISFQAWSSPFVESSVFDEIIIDGIVYDATKVVYTKPKPQYNVSHYANPPDDSARSVFYATIKATVLLI